MSLLLREHQRQGNHPLPSLVLLWLITVRTSPWERVHHRPGCPARIFYFHLRTGINGDEYGVVSKSRTKTGIFRAFESRVSTDPIQPGRGFGVSTFWADRDSYGTTSSTNVTVLEHATSEEYGNTYRACVHRYRTLYHDGGWSLGTTVTGTAGTMNAVLVGMEDGRATAVVVHWQRQSAGGYDEERIHMMAHD